MTLKEPEQMLLGLGDMPDTTKAIEPLPMRNNKPWWFNPTTATGAQRTQVAKGLHPTGRQRGHPGKRCGKCLFIDRRLSPVTCDHGGSVRAGWQACTLFSPEDDGT